MHIASLILLLNRISVNLSLTSNLLIDSYHLINSLINSSLLEILFISTCLQSYVFISISYVMPYLRALVLSIRM